MLGCKTEPLFSQLFPKNLMVCFYMLAWQNIFILTSRQILLVKLTISGQSGTTCLRTFGPLDQCNSILINSGFVYFTCIVHVNISGFCGRTVTKNRKPLPSLSSTGMILMKHHTCVQNHDTSGNKFTFECYMSNIKVTVAIIRKKMLFDHYIIIDHIWRGHLWCLI